MTRRIILFGVVALCMSITAAIAMKLPTKTAQRPQGMKALNVKPGPEPFTQNDVAQFVQTHRLARSVGDLSKLHVDSLEFITAREASIRLQGASTGLPDNERVGFAIIRGPQYFTGPMTTTKPVAFQSSYALFDAETGNLLMSGTLEPAKPTTAGGQPPDQSK